MSDSDDDAPALSAHALSALQEFYKEQTDLETRQETQPLDSMPEENWNLSQFWYSDETAEDLAREAISAAGDHGSIICLSCPTMYQKLRTLKPEGCRAVLLEYDKRFAMFGDDFLFYDYNEPVAFPADFENTFDIVVADPPFLSEECLTKVSKSVEFLSKGKVLLCTGAIMEELSKKLMKTNLSSYHPKHTRNLANEFKCFANYETKYLNSKIGCIL